MPRILFKIYFQPNAEVLCKEILQDFQHSIHSKDWLLEEVTSTGQYHNNYLCFVLKTS